MKILLWISRLLVGLLFIFSGFIKANDPLGFAYKLEEYFVLFGMDWLNHITVGVSMLICIVELCLGVALLLGKYPKIVSWVLLLMILFFTWLTGYSAYTGNVTDCGCFGDAIPLTPWQSFSKDIVLLILIGFIFFRRRAIKEIVRTKLGDGLLAFTIIFCLGFTLWCYYTLPLMDFRPYQVGGNIQELMNDGIADEYETTFLYKNKSTGKLKEFAIDNIPQDDDWEWDSTINKLVKPGRLPSIHDFIIEDFFEQTDMTEKIISNPDYNFIVVSYDLTKTSKSGFEKLKELSGACEKNNIQLITLTSSPYEITETFRHEAGAAFPFYKVDATTLKTIIRSNPGLLLLKEGTIIAKWHYNTFPVKLSEQDFID